MQKQILLTRGKIALVDAEDFDQLNVYRWYAVPNRTTFYAYTRINGEQVPMHRLLVPGADHIDHDGLNNQRCNLRPATQSQNLMNMRKTTRPTSSKFKGVCWHKKAQKWMAHIKKDGKLRYLGLFEVEAEAAKAYNAAAIELFGKFANLNDLTNNSTVC